MVRAICFLPLILAGCTTPLEAVGGEITDVCDIAANPNDFINRTVEVDVRISLDNHGAYANGVDCENIYLWTDAANNDASVRQQLWSAFGLPPQPIPISRVKGNIVMQDYRLPLTDRVSPRLRLDILEIISVRPSQ